MVDLIKFYIPKVKISEYILATKFIKVKEEKEENGFEYFKADPDLISFLSEKTNDRKPIEKLQSELILQQANKVKKLSYLNKFISFKRRKNEEFGRFSVCQNIRKDLIRIKKLNPFKDLSSNDFIEIINLYADEFKINRDEFWKAKVTYIELGVNIRFNMNITSVISSISRMRGMGDALRIGDKTINFKNQKYEVAIYDKLDREAQQGQVFKNSNKVRRKQLVKKIANHNSFVRIELRVKTVSQFNQSALKKNIQYLEHIRDHNESIGKDLYQLFANISFVNQISPDLDRRLVKSQLKSKSEKAFDDYLKFQGLKYFGITEFVDFASPILNTNIRNKYLQEAENLYNSYKKDNDFVKKEFQRKISSKIRKLTASNISE